MVYGLHHPIVPFELKGRGLDRSGTGKPRLARDFDLPASQKPTVRSFRICPLFRTPTCHHSFKKLPVCCNPPCASPLRFRRPCDHVRRHPRMLGRKAARFTASLPNRLRISSTALSILSSFFVIHAVEEPNPAWIPLRKRDLYGCPDGGPASYPTRLVKCPACRPIQFPRDVGRRFQRNLMRMVFEQIIPDSHRHHTDF